MDKYILYWTAGIGYDPVSSSLILQRESDGLKLDGDNEEDLVEGLLSRGIVLNPDDEVTTLPAPRAIIQSGTIDVPLHANQIGYFHRTYHQRVALKEKTGINR